MTDLRERLSEEEEDQDDEDAMALKALSCSMVSRCSMMRKSGILSIVELIDVTHVSLERGLSQPTTMDWSGVWIPSVPEGGATMPVSVWKGGRRGRTFDSCPLT